MWLTFNARAESDKPWRINVSCLFLTKKKGSNDFCYEYKLACLVMEAIATLQVAFKLSWLLFSQCQWYLQLVFKYLFLLFCNNYRTL